MSRFSNASDDTLNQLIIQTLDQIEETKTYSNQLRDGLAELRSEWLKRQGFYSVSDIIAQKFTKLKCLTVRKNV